MADISEAVFSRSRNVVRPEAEGVMGGARKIMESAHLTTDGETLKFKVMKSVCLVVTWICMGLYSGVTGPTIPDLCERLHTDYDSVGFALAFRSIGKMVGTMPFGYLRDRFSNAGDLLLGFVLSLVALMGNSMLVLMWKEKAALPVHFLHFGYGVGALISPLIARPFLSRHATINITRSWTNLSADNDSVSLDSTNNATVIQKDIVVKESLIEIPYAIVSAFIFFIGLVYVGFFLFKPFRRLTAMLGSCSYSKPCDAPFLKDRPKTAVSILVLFFFYYMMVNAIDRALGSFLFTYAVESDIGFSKGEAAYLNTAYFACYGGGRAIMGLSALKFSVKFIMFSEVYLMTSCLAVITFYAYDKHLYLWVFSCLVAFFFGPIYPSGVAWVDRYVPMYGLVVAVFDLGDGVGAFASNSLSGYLISNLGPHSLLYFTFFVAVGLCVNIIIAQMIGSLRGDRHKLNKDKTTQQQHA
ncbi:sodium-dependent glucose transporter 1B-like [Liolophura sinensis]|uniref:sodium-dependent glucose transporter 1B-like n=1 Tax=Liolophura sinensis TaxID=3198878 RepID=UPI003158C44C